MSTTEHPSILSDDDLRRELAAARYSVTALLNEVRDFAAIAHEHPWIYLDDLLRELRAAAVTVHVLERLQVSAG